VSVPSYIAWIFALGLLPLLPAGTVASEQLSGIRLDITMREIANTDPPESEIIDTLSARVIFGLETTLRVGNAVVYVTAEPAGESAVSLQYALFVTGPLSDQHVDEAVVEFAVPLIIDGIKGKGKSSYRMLIVPHPAIEIPEGNRMPTEESRWEVIPSAFYHFYLAGDSRAMFHFPEFRNALEYEFEAVRDTFDFKSPGKVNYYFFEGNCTDFAFDSRFDFAVDPSRNRIIARYDRYYTGVDVQATLLVNFYRWWGYAPELLAIGASGYLSFADYYVLADRANGQAIPLSALARTLDFKRQPFPASYHHAASFVRWLMVTNGHAEFRDLYDKSTDLSLERALWSVYEKTLGELETEWLAYLENRKFDVAEYYTFAKRAAAYHNYGEHSDLLRPSVARADSIPDFVNRELALAAAQLGHWDEAMKYLRTLVTHVPDDLAARNLYAEALWAYGDTNACHYQLLRLTEKDPSDARPYILLGDLQEAWRRIDSAAALWRYGLEKSEGSGPVALELLLRLGRYERRHKHADSARTLFTLALQNAYRLMKKTSAGTRAMVRLGESLMEMDSTVSARPYLEIAAYVADAPQELGRSYLNIGRCLDLDRQREQALAAYETVLALRSTQYDAAAAHHYVNNIYEH
jgi:tetratricopeptide (TPR) repeat protein